MKDLEVLYGAYGLQGHFEALMASAEVEDKKSPGVLNKDETGT
jgi:hypothetical protein